MSSLAYSYPLVTLPRQSRFALRAEDDGFYSVSLNDHFFSPLGTPQVPQLECFTTLTAVAAVTNRIRLTPHGRGRLVSSAAVAGQDHLHAGPGQ